MRKRFATAVSLGICLLPLPACSGRLYKVAPLPNSAPPVISADNATGLGVGAFVLESDSALELFDANLPLAGVVAIDVRLVNQSAGMIDSSRLKFELLDASGKNLKPLLPKKALDCVLKYYGRSFYLQAARKRTRDDFEAIALKLAEPIRAQEERRGILFFETARNTTNLNGLTLSVKGAAAPISVQLNAR